MNPDRDVSLDASAYGYGTSKPGHHHAYLLPAVERIIAKRNLPSERRRIFDLGCGNGSVGAFLHHKGYSVTGVDPSEDGIARGSAEHPYLDLRVGSCYDDLEAEYGQFPIVVSLEVVEHVYGPKKFASTLYSLVEEGGHSNSVDSLSRLLEEPGAVLGESLGCSSQSSVGARPH